ncbi:protein kinase [Antrihabitans sp. YC2-6]|uniref:protein kinase domain-containing protein n=1 Tax=Antrihabitans sp. YC2-6 TaxID=2799498 RepID=UPI0018F788F6|nr:protein kinase [Antrihabitans sp. YC2-6]MBJ8346237.1 protein kinase [Antrihabitans sp. YC2-6]
MGAYDLEPGAVFAGYTIERGVGVGGMGTIYVARHPNLPRRVALKLLHDNLTSDDYVRSRFEYEADHAARLEHPNIVAVFDRGRDADQLWIAMQFVQGTDASEIVRGGPLAVERALHIAGEVAKGLDYAHHAGVFHRDVKPANILLADPGVPGERERVLLTDFGIAKALDDTVALTQAGMMVATLRYGAPEQIDGREIDHRADQYSLACTLFHFLTGEPPYPGPHASTIMNGHLNGPIPRVTSKRRELPNALDSVFMRALAKRREDRYDSCVDMIEAARSAFIAPPEDFDITMPGAVATSTGLRVVLTDDSVLLREGIARLLRDEGIDVVGQAGDADGLLRLVAKHRPDVAVVDIRMPPTHTIEGIEAAVAIRRDYPDTGVLLLSQYVETENVMNLLGGGAKSLGYLLKDRVADVDEFVDALNRVAAGGSAIDPDLVGRLVSRPHRGRRPLDELSAREREVLQLMAEGRSNKAIGAALFLGERTVEAHVRSIFGKLGLAPEPEDHRRVLAVLTHLRETSTA